MIKTLIIMIREFVTQGVTINEPSKFIRNYYEFSMD
jgi:hypothetical protein